MRRKHRAYIDRSWFLYDLRIARAQRRGDTYYCNIGCPDVEPEGECPRWCLLANIRG